MNNIIESFGRYLQSEGRYSRHTKTAYVHDVAQFFAFIHSQYDLQDPGEIKPAFIKAWMYELSKDKISPRSVNRKLSSLNHFYKYLLRTGKLSKNPAAGINGLKTGKKLHKWIRQEELLEMLESWADPKDYASARDQIILELLYGCGIRLSELIGLRHDGLSLREGTVKVLGKRNKERIIPVPGLVVKSLDRYLLLKKTESLPMSGPLLLTDRGDALYPMYVWRLVRRATSNFSSASGISPHVMRHSYATHLLNKGAELSAIKELLGHSSLASTQVYTHTTIEQLKEIYKKAHPRGDKK
jgi:integrase/recombinase XerC